MNTAPNSIISVPGYCLIEPLYAGSRTIVYRAIRESDQLAVVIKVLQQAYPTFSDLLQFRHQYTIAKTLKSPGVVRPIDLESVGNSYALVMEDSGGIALRDYITANPLTHTQILGIAVQFTEILQDLYQHRVIHKDIKPANILIDPQSNRIQLIDFSIASFLPKETEDIKHPDHLEGTIAYLAPEQTGRMNRGIDYRADFYAFGVTLFELFTGTLPFQSDDPLEVIYCHIAQSVPRIDEIKPGIPAMIGKIVAKLMAKNAEDRYQSALGLKADLEACLHQLKATGTIEPFELGQKDVSDRFLIPEKLYGREAEVRSLLEALDRVIDQKSELMLVAGFSGIGKTAVINEVHKPITRRQGYFIKGKFDQFNRNIPFSALLQALRSLIEQVLSESDEQLAQWKTQILAELGQNAQLILNILPELEQIIGSQSSAEVSSTAQHRFDLLFHRFIQVFAQPEHPLVIFLDDLQWADVASLRLLRLLIASRHLLMIGAYRDNEVSPTHPLMVAIEEIEQAGATVNTITLQPLSQIDLNQFVADTLSCDANLAQPLATVLNQSTKGNPFFTARSLKALHEEGLIQFDQQQQFWTYNISEIKARSLSDDVVELLVQQLQKLPVGTQETLKLAACIGTQFDSQMLAMIQKMSQAETLDRLWQALQEELILPVSKVYRCDRETFTTGTSTYRFVHDQVQQAAYSLIPADQKQSIHLQIGRLLLAQNQPNQLFNVVNQLNTGIPLIVEDSERDRVAELNLKAAQKARASTAYRAASDYAQTGILLLGTNGWQQQYSIMLQLHDLAAETAFLIGDFDRVAQIRAVILTEAKSLLDRVSVEETQIQTYCLERNYGQAIAIGLQMLKQLGIALPAQPSSLSVKRQLTKTKQMLRGLSIETVLALPKMEKRETIAALRIMELLLTPAFFVSRPLAMLLPLVGIQKSITDGNCTWSSSFYSCYSFVLSGSPSIEDCYQAGQIALEVLDQLPNPIVEGKVKIITAYFSQPWGQPLRNSLPLIRSGHSAALESGDLSHVTFGYCTEIWTRFYLGESIDTLLSKADTYYQAAIEQKDQQGQQILSLVRQLLLNFVDSSPLPHCLIGSAFDETQSIPQCQARNNATVLASIYAYKAWLAYWFGDCSSAFEYANLQVSYEQDNLSNCMVALRWWFDTLIRLAAYPTCNLEQQKQLIKQININQRKLQHRADQNPIDFQHKCDLLQAERYRVFGQIDRAMQYYDQAIAGAKKNNYIQDEALANELAARFYLDQGRERIAQLYLTDAYYAYSRWGAKAKIEQLEQHYFQLLTPILQKTATFLNPLQTTLESISVRIASSLTQTQATHVLDFATLFKLSQTLSSEIDLARLIDRLLQIVLESAGANRCVLIFKEQEWTVKAVGQIDAAGHWSLMLSAIALNDYADLPLPLIRSVKRSLKSSVIANAANHSLIVADPYILRQQPKSILCLPVLHQGQPLAILYLENQIAIDAFTPDRVEWLNLLCAQAAISLQNAYLYQQAQTYVQQLEHSQLQIVQSEKMASLGNLVAGVAHEINNPISFLNGSINNAKEFVADLLDYLALYHQHHPDAATSVQNKAEKIDLDFLIQDLPKLLASMEGATDRIREISTSLRTFSRADTEHKVGADLHDGINSTLLILKYRLKENHFRPAIQVIQNYGQLPLIDCFPGQLNQVFMNILANAIDVFDEMAQHATFADLQANPQTITIQTLVVEDAVEIRIRDNGQGMSEDVKARIFDHLFTTKGVGKGTGLGLAIARQIIVEKHGGSLEVESAIGQGTQFCIRLSAQVTD